MTSAAKAFANHCQAWQMPIRTPLGSMTLVATDLGLSGAWFDNQRHKPPLEHLPWGPKQHWLQATKQQISEYFAGQREQFELALHAVCGSLFQQQVWQAMRQIPFGRFSTYSELAQHLNHRKAARAVGMAVGRNPWSIIVPCHRVVAANGALSGYAGGLERKLALLQQEGVLG
ncbi:MAG: methylated-DNA--[protein]-cysteine S-methyltransferase [Betaproteobacteria bacterium]|nr:methylated-DNA--[protein]-cysteine S-methyltransferase [Betaproteobacteria bacterium]